MVLRQHRTSQWTRLLAKVVFLQCVVVSASHAVELNTVTPTVIAPTTDSTSDSLNNIDISDDPTLLQLNLDRGSIDDLETDASILDLYLDVMLNGASKGLVHFYYRDEQLLASPTILQQLGFIVPSDSSEPILLNRLPDLQIDYNARQQAVTLIAPLSMLNLDATVLNTRTNNRPKPSASPGMLLNYNLYGSQSQNSIKNFSAYTELRAFNDTGVFSSTALATANHSTSSAHDNGDWNSKVVRLDSSWSRSYPDKLITIRAGDILTGALSWTRSTRLGGLQIGTNFDLQPYRSTTPLPSFFGSATLPSAVELYVNGLKQYSGDVPAGPFELNTTPSFSGVGNAQLVVTDALGQRTTLNFSLYDAHRLLQPGLSDWSFELGTVRENYGNRSFDYGDAIVAIGTWRRGISDRFSAETHAEITEGLTNTGVGGTWLLGRAGGILFASLAGSKSQDDVGMQYSTNYSWNNRRFNIGLSAKGTNGTYRDVGTQYGSALARRSEQLSTGYSTQDFGRFGFSYNQVTQAEKETGRFASAYWSKSFGRRFNVSANYNHDLNDSANNSASLSASFSLNNNISLNSNLQHTENNTIVATDVSRSAPSIGGFGWRAQARRSLDDATSNDNNTSGAVELNYLGRYGRAQASISSNNGQYSSYASATGALVKMGGGVFAARQINSGFAVVSTDGIADVPVLLQNNLIGSTNRRGLLLISPLNAYQNNKIAIDPLQLPADMRIDKVSIDATPTDRAGILVAFGITPVRSASVILVDSDNEPLALGSQVRQLTNTDVPSTVVGFDGEVYLDTLDERNVLEVTTPTDIICTVEFDYTKQGDEIPLIGPFICQETKK